MTTDIERELRELFREKAGEAPTATFDTSGSAPQEVLRRGRRRQVGTVLGSAAIVLVLIVGSVAGLNAMLRSEEDPFTTGDYDVFERTATIEAFTVTSPSDWFLVNEWPLSLNIAVGSGSSSKECTVGVEPPVCTGDQETSVEPLPQGLPMLQLSNTDMGLSTVACGADLAAGTAVLYVALDYQRSIEGIADPALGPWPGVAAEENGACGPGSYARFTVNGEPFFAWIGFGEGVTDADRSTVQAAFDSMMVDDEWEPVPPEQVTPAYVIAGGSTEVFNDWRLELRSSEPNVELSLIGEAPAVRDGFFVHDSPTDWCCKDSPMGVLFGAVQKGATGIASQPTGGEAIAGTILPLPPSLPFDFDLFFIEGTEGLPGNIVALGLEERLPPPPVVGPRDAVVELSGTFLDQSWKVRFTGAFADETACIRARTGDANGWGGGLCPRPLETSLAGDQPSLHVLSSDFALVVGSVPREVAEIRFTSDDRGNDSSQFQCQIGPLGWTDPDRKVCALALPSQDSGTFEYLDAGGMVLFEEEMGWGASKAEAVGPIPVDPVHGGSYWGVYAWLGSGAEEAQIEAIQQQLLEDHGVRGLRGSLFCDEGAAEALGTSAEHKVAVYFETEEEANKFALEAGLLGHEAGPVVAKVTIACLE